MITDANHLENNRLPEAKPPASKKSLLTKKNSSLIILDLLLILVILAGAYLRSAGLFWGEYQYLHPDERFLIWVGTDISPVKIETGDTSSENVEKKWLSFADYFNTAESSLNPNNRGHNFYVYGTLPMFMARYLAEIIFGHSGFDVMTQVGRALSALSDLLAVLMVYLIASRLYDRRVGLLATVFSTVAVLQIQQSHFFTTDTFSNLFTYLAFYFAVRVMTTARDPGFRKPGARTDSQVDGETETPSRFAWVRWFFHHPWLWPSVAFGVFYGMAMASKLSIYPLALVLPAAMALRISSISREQWSRRAAEALVFLIIAGGLSLLVFRIAQPYAFSGPGFFNIKPNPAWVNQIREQRNQATPEVDFPPAMQWARRPIWFSFQNLTIWGLGLPLGLLAWAGFIWAGWRMLKGEWRKHLLLWAWTGVYFAWQSLALNPTMRYQLPIYPALAIFAAWFIVALWDLGKEKESAGMSEGKLYRYASAFIGAVVIISSSAYAFSFSQIYDRPITRVEASRWIYQNIPGPINLRIQSAGETINQPLPFPYGGTLIPGLPYDVNFIPKTGGVVSEIYMPHVRDLQTNIGQATLDASILGPDGSVLSTTSLTAGFSDSSVKNGEGYKLKFDPPLNVVKDSSYRLHMEVRGTPPEALLNSQSTLRFRQGDGRYQDYPILADHDAQWQSITSNISFNAPTSGDIIELFLPMSAFPTQAEALNGLLLSWQLRGGDPGMGDSSATELIPGRFIPSGDPRGAGILFQFDNPISLSQGEIVNLSLAIKDYQSALTLNGAGIANEGDWDDGLPLRVDGYDGFGGIYPLDLNFNMYWDDNFTKFERFARILDESDYIVITSNRQWGSLPRIPERFPMTTIYYRALLGCPPETDIVWCYRVVKAGEDIPSNFKSDLGFELVKTFESEPSVGPINLNDQFAEEAFTVYDHPKVLIFRKTDDYDPEKVRALLGSVDFDKVIRLAPLKFKSQPADLLLPVERWVEQQKGGAWADLFNVNSLINRNQAIGVIVWYLSLGLLGLAAYPILRRALPGLADGGYPLARTAGMLILSYGTWLAGSFRIPFTRPTITVIALIIFIAGGVLAYLQRAELRQEWRERKGYFLIVEALFLAFFLILLLIRLGNPDLWHPYKGGEKPMDFSYFNAVLKSTTFPPYDPWYAGGYLNYYYYGFVFVGALVKWLGIVPAFAYNLILPTLFALIAMGAFSVSWNAYLGVKEKRSSLKAIDDLPPDNEDHARYLRSKKPFWVGLAGALGMAAFGNLGTVSMIYEGYQRLAAPGGVIEGANPFVRLGWAVQGFIQNLGGTPLPYGIGDWYWNPSRVIPAPGEVAPITEFPFFTVLYADLHAHLFSMAIALLAIGFALSVVLARGRWKGILGAALGFLLGGLAIGALRPTNTWDFYTYLALGVVCLGYAVWRYFRPQEVTTRLKFLVLLPETAQRLLVTAAGVILLIVLSFVLFQPYAQWYGQGYNKIALWQGLRTPLNAYLIHWGLFLFVIISWMIWETRVWMADTPMSQVRLLKPYQGLIIGLSAALFLVTILLAVKIPAAGTLPFGQGVVVALIALPLAAWAGVMLLRPNLPDAKRFILFLIGTGLVLTLMVEIIVLVGDIGRMNTVFKFYLQVWTLLAISAAAGFGWLLDALPEWSGGWRRVWIIGFTILVAGAFLYPLTASRGKILDRMTNTAPHTLDGMKYMEYSQYDWGGLMDLSQDYRAIRWLQENVDVTEGDQDIALGSPVIVEANMRDLYRWGSRYTIYTGLPGVVGWEWHQQQQRALLPGNWVSDRIAEVEEFYNTTDPQIAKDFLIKFGVKYIIVGQLERNMYPGSGLSKFAEQAGVLWKEVYRDGQTVIYEAIQS